MAGRREPTSSRVPLRWVGAALLAATVAACGASPSTAGRASPASHAAASVTAPPPTLRRRPPRPLPSRHADAAVPLPPPAPLDPFTGRPAGQGTWKPAGRPVGGVPAVFETSLVPPGGTEPAGVAWMDPRLLSARLYSGSVSPGGGPYRYTAPIEAPQAATLVAAFNGGFKMHDARGGYFTQGRGIYPLRAGAASLVIYRNGTVDIGAWGRDVFMTGSVVGVRQNLVPLVASGRPTPAAESPRWQTWGNTCGVASCAASVPGVDHQWRSGLGITPSGALVYVCGPALDPRQLAELLVRAGVVRGMELDINPYWTVFATYDPLLRQGLAGPANGSRLLPDTIQGPATFFEPSWARDFVTMSARAVPVAQRRSGTQIALATKAPAPVR